MDCFHRSFVFNKEEEEKIMSEYYYKFYDWFFKWRIGFKSLIAYCSDCKTLYKVKLRYFYKKGTKCYFCKKNHGVMLGKFAIQNYKLDKK